MACFALVFVLATIVGLSSARAVNISNTWMLPEEGFPVFYRYFRDRISWYEADAVCQFHHANLVTADATSQYDAIRAYLKELDITDKVWIGLSKTSERPNFTWTDFQPLSGEGHWQEAIPKSNDPICVAVDAASDFLWKALPCGGPDIASFICELPIPSWALGPKGCLLTELPSLTVLYIPEQSAIELTSDCGLDGTKRIACKGSADREEILKQLTCAISHEDFDEKTTKPPLVSSTVYDTSPDENSSSGKTTRTWIWTSNTVDIDYGVPTRHRRETEDTLSPVSTKSTTGMSTRQIYGKKIATTETFTTPATNYEAEVTTNSVEGDSTLDSSVTRSPDKSVRFNESQENLTTQEVITSPDRQTEVTSTSSADVKYTERDVDDNGADYPSAINQGQLFSIIENGTMFDIIELNDTTSEMESRTSQGHPSTQENELKLPTLQLTEHHLLSTLPPTKKYEEQTTPVKEDKRRKPKKKDAYKLSESKKSHKVLQSPSSSPKPVEVDFTKEVPLFPIVKDHSLKLNRTFRKELPSNSKEYSDIESSNKFATSKLIDLSVSNELSNPSGEHDQIEIQLKSKSTEDVTETLLIATSIKKNDSHKNTTNFVSEEIEILEKESKTPHTKPIAEIDPGMDLLNSNHSRNNESEMLDNSFSEKAEEISQTTLSITKKEFLPKSLIKETYTTLSTSNSDHTTASEDPVDVEPEERSKPNRQRQLTRPQRRSFYPYFFSRVLG